MWVFSRFPQPTLSLKHLISSSALMSVTLFHQYVTYVLVLRYCCQKAAVLLTVRVNSLHATDAVVSDTTVVLLPRWLLLTELWLRGEAFLTHAKPLANHDRGCQQFNQNRKGYMEGRPSRLNERQCFRHRANRVMLPWTVKIFYGKLCRLNRARAEMENQKPFT